MTGNEIESISKIILYLDENMREKLLDYDRNICDLNDFESILFYIRNDEKYILENILENMCEEKLVEFGFDEKTIYVIQECVFEVRFTKKDKYYLKGIENIEFVEVSFENFCKNYCECDIDE